MMLRLLDASDPRAQTLLDLPTLHPLVDRRQELQKNNIYIADYTGTDNTIARLLSLEAEPMKKAENTCRNRGLFSLGGGRESAIGVK